MMQGLIGYDKGYKFYSNCNGKPLEKKISSREMKMFGLGLKKKSLWLLCGEWTIEGQERKLGNWWGKYSFNKYLLRAYYMQDTVLSIGATAVNKIEKKNSYFM